jgi:hypothetical protein
MTKKLTINNRTKGGNTLERNNPGKLIHAMGWDQHQKNSVGAKIRPAYKIIKTYSYLTISGI